MLPISSCKNNHAFLHVRTTDISSSRTNVYLPTQRFTRLAIHMNRENIQPQNRASFEKKKRGRGCGFGHHPKGSLQNEPAHSACFRVARCRYSSPSKGMHPRDVGRSHSDRLSKTLSRKLDKCQEIGHPGGKTRIQEMQQRLDGAAGWLPTPCTWGDN